VKVGSTVRWVNQDSVPHRIVFADKSISSVLLAASQSASQKFDQPGVFDYICSIHPDMQGTVIVE
jgi:plastocyanin